MKNLNFLQNDEDFLLFLRERRKKVGENSVIPDIEDVLYKNNIKLIDIFFLNDYLKMHKCSALNDEFVEIFNRATYLNEKIGVLESLMWNDYDQSNLQQIINLELSKEYNEKSFEDIESYRYDLNELLRLLKKRHMNKK